MAVGTAKIFLVNPQESALTALAEAAYEKEEHLQEFLATYPDLIPGDQIADPPCRWMLISREMGVSDGEAGARWSLDHLFVDQNAIPTFIECKRSSDTRGRREVVAQMLDYAANGVAYWKPAEIQEAATRSCLAAGTTLDQAMDRLLGLEGSASPSAAKEQFWLRLGENLLARKIRLIFVADKIPLELKKLVEFLNEEMANVEVLAVEVRQFVEANGDHKVLVPAVIGMTTRAQATKETAARNKITADEFIGKCSDASKEFFRDLLARAESLGAKVSWGTVGCSIRILDPNGRPHSIAYCYPPESLSYNLDANATSDEGLRETLRRHLLTSGLVKEAGQFTLRVPFSASNADALLDQFSDVVERFATALSGIQPKP